ncbi:MAG: hypothetical protein AB7I32_14435 [Gammaproteobacteria bacterium]
MRQYCPFKHARLFAFVLATVSIGLSSPVSAAGGSPTRHEAGPSSSPRVAYKASNKTYRPLAPRETAEFARVEIAPAREAVPGNPLMKGSSPFYPEIR